MGIHVEIVGIDAEIVGIDVDQVALEKARKGIYHHNSFRSVSPDIVERHFQSHGNGAHQVKESLRTWSNKRERIAVFPSASLLEFASAADLYEALARGLPGVRLSDRLAAVASEAIEATELLVTDSYHGGAEPRMTLTRERSEARLRPLLEQGIPTRRSGGYRRGGNGGARQRSTRGDRLLVGRLGEDGCPTQ